MRSCDFPHQTIMFHFSQRPQGLKVLCCQNERTDIIKRFMMVWWPTPHYFTLYNSCFCWSSWRNLF